MTTEISIIIPCYRVELYIVRAVRSLLAQTYPYWRAILVSDDAVDYLSLLAGLGIIDDRLRQVTTGGVGTGLSHARNVGLRACNTDYVATLDADDAYESKRLASVMPVLADHPLVMTGLKYINDDTGKLIPTQTLLGKDQRVFMHDSPKIMVYGASTWCFNRQHIRHFWYENVRVIEDQLWTMLAYDSIESIYFLTKPSYLYYRRIGSLAHSADTPQWFIQAKQKIAEDIQNGMIPIVQSSVRDYILNFYTISLETEKEYKRLLEAGNEVLFSDLFIVRLKQAGVL